MTNRLNLGCGSVIFDGWDNCDINLSGNHSFLNRGGIITRHYEYDIMKPWEMETRYDYIFCNHLLSNFSHHELPTVLHNIREMLNDGGRVHILVPDAIKAFQAYTDRDRNWFPQGDDISLIDERLCTFLTWFGESKSTFTEKYLLTLGDRAGFSNCRRVEWGFDEHDDRKGECIVAEFTR